MSEDIDAVSLRRGEAAFAKDALNIMSEIVGAESVPAAMLFSEDLDSAADLLHDAIVAEGHTHAGATMHLTLGRFWWKRWEYLAGETNQEDARRDLLARATLSFYCAQRDSPNVNIDDLPSSYTNAIGGTAGNDSRTFYLEIVSWLTEKDRDDTHDPAHGLRLLRLRKLQLADVESFADEDLQLGCRSNVASAQRWLAVRNNDGGLAEEAVRELDACLAILPNGDERRPRYLNNLANAHLAWFDIDSRLHRLERSWDLVLQAFSEHLPSDALKIAITSNIANIGRRLYQQVGNEHILQRAYDCATAVRIAEGSDEYNHLLKHGAPLDGLANGRALLLINLYLRNGDRELVDVAVSDARECVRQAQNDGGTAVGLGTLSIALEIRFDAFHKSRDLDEAIAALTKAEGWVPEGHPTRPHFLSNLSGYYQTRSREAPDHEAAMRDAETACRLVARAIGLSNPEEVDLPRTLEAAASRFLYRYDLQNSESDLRQGVEFARSSLTKTHSSDPELARRYSLLAGGLHKLSSLPGEPSEGQLSEVVELLDQAVQASSALGLETCNYLYQLGERASEMYRVTSTRAYADRGLNAWESAAAMEIGDPNVRFEAAARWGEFADEIGDKDSALRAFSRATELLRQLAWRGFALDHRESALSGKTWVVREAVRLSLDANLVETAFELFELSRNLLWEQASDLVRPLDAELGPDIISDMRSVQMRLARLEGIGFVREASEPGRLSVDEERRALNARWTTLMEVARRDAASAISLDEAVRLSHPRACVMVNVSSTKSHAMVLNNDSCTVIQLPGLDWDSAGEVAVRINLAITRCARHPNNGWYRYRANHELLEGMDWLWRVLVAPIVDATGLRDIVWVTTGPLVGLPIHAALSKGRLGRSGTSDIVSSYSRSVYALRAEMGGRVSQMTLIGGANAPGKPRLAHVEEEMDAVAALVGVATRADEATPTVDEFLHLLHESPCLHVACHGALNRHSPSMSVLSMRDGEVTLRQIFAHAPPSPQWAFISACETASVPAGLTEEGLNVAGAFQAAGYPSVVGTLWQVDDAFSAWFASALYQRLVVDGTLETALASQALHDVMDEFRRRLPRKPILWAPYVHFGI